MRPAGLVAVATFAFCLARSVSAVAEPTPSELALARELFAEASALEEAGNWAAAAVKLREALSIKETPGLRYHLAHCEEQSGQLVTASLEYARASELIREGAQAPDVAQLLALADQRLAARIPKLILRLPADVQGASVEIDGHGVTPTVFRYPVPLDPGTHQIVARAPNRSEFSRSVSLSAGETRTLDLELSPAPAPISPRPGSPASSVAESDRGGFDPRTMVLIGEGVLAVAGLAMGIGFGVARARAADKARVLQGDVDYQSSNGNAACHGTAPAPSCAELQAALDDHQTATVLMTVGFVGAGVGVTAGVLTWALWPKAATNVAVDAGPGRLFVQTGARF